MHRPFRRARRDYATAIVIATAVCLSLSLSIPSPAHAGASSGLRPLWVGVGGAAGGELGEPQASAFGTLAVGLRLIPVVPEFVVREGVSGGTDALRYHHGSIAFGARFLLPQLAIVRPHLRIAFSHRHDAPIWLFRAQPLKVIFGLADGITHRSGVETGGGLEVQITSVFGLYVQGTLFLLSSGQDLPISGVWEFGVSFGIGKPQS